MLIFTIFIVLLVIWQNRYSSCRAMIPYDNVLYCALIFISFRALPGYCLDLRALETTIPIRSGFFSQQVLLLFLIELLLAEVFLL